MSEIKPVLKKPPGFRDPNIPVQKPPYRKPNLPPSFYPKKNRRSFCRTCCCFLFLLIIIVTLFSIAAGGLLYIWFDPRVPVFHLKALKIPKFSITVSPDGALLNAGTVISVEVKNPNSELRMVYDRSRIYLKSEDGLDLGSAGLGGFTQDKKNITVLKFTVEVRNMVVDDGVGRKLKDGFKSKRLRVSVELRTRVGLSWRGWTTGVVGLKVPCGAPTLERMESGAMPICKLLKWINL